MPGLSIACASRDSVTGTQAGVLAAGTAQAVTDGTIFEAASLSKPVFAFAVLEQLVARGKLDLDRPLDAYLVEPYPSADDRTALITARHVLTHTSGLPNWRHSMREPLRLAFAPGAQYLYSGEGFYFLQTVVEAISGVGLGAFMRPTLDALGMYASDYVWRRSYAIVAAHPHDIHGNPLPWDSELLGTGLNALVRGDGGSLDSWKTSQALEALGRISPPRDALPWNAMPNAAWSLFTTGPDYGAFVRELLRRPEHPMLVPSVRISAYVSRGLGVAIQVRDGNRTFYHTGANPGFKSAMFGDLSAGRGIVTFANGDGGFPLNMHVTESALGAQPAIFALEQP